MDKSVRIGAKPRNGLDIGLHEVRYPGTELPVGPSLRQVVYQVPRLEEPRHVALDRVRLVRDLVNILRVLLELLVLRALGIRERCSARHGTRGDTGCEMLHVRLNSGRRYCGRRDRWRRGWTSDPGTGANREGLIHRAGRWRGPSRNRRC